MPASNEAKAVESEDTEAVPAVPAVLFYLFLHRMRQKQLRVVRSSSRVVVVSRSSHTST